MSMYDQTGAFLSGKIADAAGNAEEITKCKHGYKMSNPVPCRICHREQMSVDLKEEIKDLTGLVIRLKAGKYSDTDLMNAWTAIEWRITYLRGIVE